MPIKLLLAPDSFKGSLSAAEVCDSLSAGLRQHLPDAQIQQLPLADGGEGTLDAFLALTPGRRIELAVRDPLGQLISAHYAQLDDGQTAVIEMAEASGLTLLEPQQRDPIRTSSFGTGELIRHALDAGCRRLIIGLGGSATNDCGAGMLQALGLELLDRQGQPLAQAGGALNQLAEIRTHHLHPAITSTEFILAADVTNPLLGAMGATAIYGPQKGLKPRDRETLEAGLRRFADLSQRSAPFPIPTSTPGSGAAGGAGFGLMAYCAGQMRSGFELLAELSGLDQLLSSAQRPDVIITGEGRLDLQSLHGKLVGRMLQKAARHHIPILLVCGAVAPGLELGHNAGILGIIPLAKNADEIPYAMQHAREMLIAHGQRLANLIPA